MKILNLSSGLLYCYESSTRCISVFSGQIKVMAIKQLMERLRNNFLLSEWMSDQSNQVSFSYKYSELTIPLEFFYYKSESKIQLHGYKLKTKQTKSKSGPGLIAIDNKVVSLLDLSNQFKIIREIKVNWALA